MLVLVCGGLLSAAGGYLVALQIPPVYESRATLLVNVSPAGGIPTYSDITVSQQLVKTYAVMAVQPAVLGAVAQQLGLPPNTQALGRAVTGQPGGRTRSGEPRGGEKGRTAGSPGPFKKKARV